MNGAGKKQPFCELGWRGNHSPLFRVSSLLTGHLQEELPEAAGTCEARPVSCWLIREVRPVPSGLTLFVSVVPREPCVPFGPRI